MQRQGKKILFAGTGGQGVITAAKLLSDFFVHHGHQVVSGQLHGMAQRGGAVQSTVMIDCGMSPMMQAGGADVVLGCEPVETVRALPFISIHTTVIMNVTPVVPFVLSQKIVRGASDAKYPTTETLLGSLYKATPLVVSLNATEIAENLGSVKSLNVVMLGCLFGSGVLGYTPDDFLRTAMNGAPSKFADTNRAAFLAGVGVMSNQQQAKETLCP